MFEMKGNKARILLVAILSMLFAIFGIYNFKSWATGAGGSANTNIAYVDPATTATLPGKQESFYLSAGLSGAAGTYIEPYSIIYLDRTKFVRPKVQDVSGSSTIKKVSVTWDATHWKIKVTYNM